MANGQFVADVPGAVQRGLQFEQAGKLRPLQQQQAQLGIERQQQQLQTGALQQRSTQQQIDIRSDEQKNIEFVTSALQLSRVPDNQKLQALQQREQEIRARGGDTSDTMVGIQLAQEGRFDELNTEIGNIIKNGEALGILKAPPKISSGQAEFESKLKNLTPEQREEAILINLGINPRAVSSADITIAESPELTKQVADSKAIIGQRKKFGELTGSSRAKTIDKGFEKIVKIDTGLRNIDRAIDALNSGAGVGAIERFLPSFKAASVELDNIQKSMALDVIGAVTFGALSQGELNLAKEVALPTGLDTPQLIEHLQSRKASQEKLRAYFNEQIQFLDQGGTVAGFLRQKESGAPPQVTTAATDGVTQPQVTDVDLSTLSLDELIALRNQG